jgi:hypothetical protein
VTLLDKARQGDRPSWERLLKLYRPLVLWWCRARVARREDAEDVAQEVFTTVFGRLGEFTKSGRFAVPTRPDRRSPEARGVVGDLRPAAVAAGAGAPPWLGHSGVNGPNTSSLLVEASFPRMSVNESKKAVPRL